MIRIVSKDAAVKDNSKFNRVAIGLNRRENYHYETLTGSNSDHDHKDDDDDSCLESRSSDDETEKVIRRRRSDKRELAKAIVEQLETKMNQKVRDDATEINEKINQLSDDVSGKLKGSSFFNLH